MKVIKILVHGVLFYFNYPELLYWKVEVAVPWKLFVVFEDYNSFQVTQC